MMSHSSEPPHSNGAFDPKPRTDSSSIDRETISHISSKIHRACELLDLVSHPIRLRILLILHAKRHTTSELLIKIPRLSEPDLLEHLEIMQRTNLLDSFAAEFAQIHNLTEIGHNLAVVAISLGAN